jgi:hypothetical protein
MTETKPQYRKAADRRPWTVHHPESALKDRFIMWLQERGGIVVYENQMLDSSARGDQTFMPVRFVASEDDLLHWAPMEHRPDGGLPSRRQQQVDVISLEDFPDTTPASVVGMCFKFEEPAPVPAGKRRYRRGR